MPRNRMGLSLEYQKSGDPANLGLVYMHRNASMQNDLAASKLNAEEKDNGQGLEFMVSEPKDLFVFRVEIYGTADQVKRAFQELLQKAGAPDYIVNCPSERERNFLRSHNIKVERKVHLGSEARPQRYHFVDTAPWRRGMQQPMTSHLNPKRSRSARYNLVTMR